MLCWQNRIPILSWGLAKRIYSYRVCAQFLEGIAKILLQNLLTCKIFFLFWVRSCLSFADTGLNRTLYWYGSGTSLKPIHWDLFSDAKVSPKSSQNYATCKTQTQHFSLLSQEEERQKCLEFVFPVHQVFFALIGRLSLSGNPLKNKSLSSRIVSLLVHHDQSTTRKRFPTVV